MKGAESTRHDHAYGWIINTFESSLVCFVTSKSDKSLEPTTMNNQPSYDVSLGTDKLCFAIIL